MCPDVQSGARACRRGQAGKQQECRLPQRRRGWLRAMACREVPCAVWAMILAEISTIHPRIGSTL